MTASRELDRLIHAFLQEGEEQLHDQVFDAVRAAIEHKPQRAFHGPWRGFLMNRFATFGLGLAVVVVVGLILGSQLLGGPGRTTGGAPTATPTPSPSTSSSEAGLPTGPFALAAPDGQPSTTVIIPAPGWTFDAELDALGKGKEVANVPEATVLFWSWKPGTGFYVFGDPCRWPSTKPKTPVTTPDDIAAGLAVQAHRDASKPVDVTVGGYHGKATTLHVPDDASLDTCQGGVFATYGTEDDDLARYQQGAGQVDDLWILDVEGSIVIIDATYRPDSRLDLVEEMRAIAESATFELP